MFNGLVTVGFNTDGVGQFLFKIETDLGGDREGRREKKGEHGSINYFLL